MSGLTASPEFTLTIGASRRGEIPPELRRALLFPAGKPLIKQEDKTLVWRLELAPGEAGVVKLYRRRGAWNRLRGSLLPFRVQREYNALRVLTDGGVPCSQPLLWGRGSAPAHGSFELLVTRELAGAVSLKDRLATGGRGLRPDELLPLFPMLRRMHGCGVYHGALSPKNILVVESPDPRSGFHLIDLARAVCFPGDITGSSMARFDLLSLMRRLRQLRGDAGGEAFLREYGLTEREVGGFLDRLKRFHPTNHTRNWLALRFGLQARLARFSR